MLRRLISVPIPEEKFQQEELASAICDKIRLDVLMQSHDNIQEAANILKSPALFGVCNSFAVKEYLKNTADKMTELQKQGALSQDEKLHMEIYLQIRDDKSVVCMIKDDGPGFPDGFLKRKENENMVDYYNKKLVTADGQELRNIVSDKSTKLDAEGNRTLKLDKDGAQGGKGLGLATVARVLRKSNNAEDEAKEINTMLIGNVSDLPANISQSLSSQDKSDQHGAVILLQATPFDQAKLANFEKLEKGSLLNKYVNYVNAMETELALIRENQNEIDDNLSSITDRVLGIKLEEEAKDEEEEEANAQIELDREAAKSIEKTDSSPELESSGSVNLSSSFARKFTLNVSDEDESPQNNEEEGITMLSQGEPVVAAGRPNFSLDLGEEEPDAPDIESTIEFTQTADEDNDINPPEAVSKFNLKLDLSADNENLEAKEMETIALLNTSIDNADVLDVQPKLTEGMVVKKLEVAELKPSTQDNSEKLEGTLQQGSVDVESKRIEVDSQHDSPSLSRRSP